MKLASRCLVALASIVTTVAAHACPTQADRSLVGPEVGQQMVVNGLPLQIQQVASKESLPDLLGRVERRWRDAGFDVKRHGVEPWQVVAALSDQCLTTLQLRSVNGQSVGFLGIGDVSRTKDRAVVVRKADVPLPTGASVVSSVAAADGPRTSTTTVVTSRRSATEVRDEYLMSLPGAGWRELRPQELGARDAARRAHIINARRGRDVLQIVITDTPGTTAVITQGQAL